MATARIGREAPFCSKRHRLEKRVIELGHKWPKEPRSGLPMTAWDCVTALLGFLDERGDPGGRLVGLTDSDIESEARWTGADGVLVKALAQTGWLDREPAGFFRFHDYWTFNGRVLRDRNKKRFGQPVPPAIEAALKALGAPPTPPGFPHQTGGEQSGEQSGESGGEEHGEGSGEDAGEEGGASGSGSESGSQSGSGSTSKSRGGSDARAREAEPGPPPSKPSAPRSPDRTGVVDDLAPKLADALDERDLAACRKAVAELLAEGVTANFLRARIAAITDPIGVWTWKRMALAAWREASPPVDRKDHGPIAPAPGSSGFDDRRREDLERLEAKERAGTLGPRDAVALAHLWKHFGIEQRVLPMLADPGSAA